MNEKINLQELATLLSQKAAITKKEAERFLREYFDVMNEGLIKSGLLKIKDLGFFKLSPVEDRESIDVTTGERVLIPAHYKITFTPDKKLAEIVNEPFALFETTEIEEGIEQDELKAIPYDEIQEDVEPLLLDEEEPIDQEELSDQVESMDQIKQKTYQEPNFTGNKEISLQEHQEPPLVKENEESYAKKTSINTPDSKNFCLNCHDYEAHHVYRKKYIKTKKSLNRWRVIAFVLSVLLGLASAYIIYRYVLEKRFTAKESVPAVAIKNSAQDRDTVSTVSVSIIDSIVSIENAGKKEIIGKINTPDNSNVSKQITIAPGQRLTTIALDEYGDKAFWIYIYLENKKILSNPDSLPVGVKISIPPAGKYGINSNDSASVQRAIEFAGRRP